MCWSRGRNRRVDGRDRRGAPGRQSGRGREGTRAAQRLGATGTTTSCATSRKHGEDIEPILKELLNSQIGGFTTPLSRKFLEQSFDRARDWLDWGST
jgi:hypothetical protein